ncbi:hypothetical protein P171DRAFT_483883 [Karstenula rhodostoma CBS 690.94]|uniref:Uncharacterized protein n=1 Tax=Karstenula rhodostoma CBS 690.94 TaxID=1392251 RepID=A0A9P4PNL3_9PLEO|nr:hypothetical protein P171DRAFT_483883 [Karstenula rhodostoma CBS 690.94]
MAKLKRTRANGGQPADDKCRSSRAPWSDDSESKKRQKPSQMNVERREYGECSAQAAEDSHVSRLTGNFDTAQLFRAAAPHGFMLNGSPNAWGSSYKSIWRSICPNGYGNSSQNTSGLGLCNGPIREDYLPLFHNHLPNGQDPFNSAPFCWYNPEQYVQICKDYND